MWECELLGDRKGALGGGQDYEEWDRPPKQYGVASGHYQRLPMLP